MRNDILVDIKGLTKIYKGRFEPAVSELSLQVYKGEIFGLLGPNGAGKTTTISILCSLLEPTSGEIRIAGLDLHHDLIEIKRHIGVVSQDIALYDKLTAFENLFYFGSLYGIDKHTLKIEINNLLNHLGLEKYIHEKVGNYSGGMKRRINLIAGVLHNPKLLFLDEPTVGVDVQTRNLILEYLLELKTAGTTIIYTSHILEDAQRLCNRVAIIDYGKEIITGKPIDLIEKNDDCRTLEDVFLKLTGRNIRD